MNKIKLFNKQTKIQFLVIFAFSLALFLGSNAYAKPDVQSVLKNYADIAQAKYEDSLTTAKTLKTAIDSLLKTPNAKTLAAARQAWIAARVPYQQTEVFRFGNSIVDDWEGKVNAWPLDEGLIDYVDSSYGTESDENELYLANVIANTKLKLGGKTIDTSKITKALLEKELQEAGEIEANVATGYHAVEFLLWGQDLNGTGPGAGNRPASDYDLKNCTNGNCERRAEYLSVATNLLIDDLEWIVKQWQPGGDARKAVLENNDNGLVALFTGLGSLSYGELAGERMKLGLLLHDPEEEHDCFADNTHNSHYYNTVGMQNVYLGRYKRIDGSVISGPSASDLVKAADAKADSDLTAKLAATVAAMGEMVKRAEAGEAYDQQIGEGNVKGNAVVQAAIDGLLNQTKSIERAIAALKLKPIEFEGSDSLDAPEKVKSE
ncbi:MAG: imelysin family protein [Pseudomonadota bacterium]